MKIKSIILFAVLSLALLGCSSSKQQTEFTVAYLPVEDSTEIQSVHTAFETALSEAIGLDVKSYQTTSYSAAIEAVTSGKVDMVQLTPFSYVVAEGKGGAHLLVNAAIPETSDSDYISCLIVAKDSDIQSVDDIKGKIMAFGDPASTTGHLVPKYYLMTNFGLTVDEIENDFFSQVLFSGGHDKTVLGVAQGTYDVGATYCQMPSILAGYGVIAADDVRIIGGAGKDLGVELSGVPVVVRDGLSSDLEEKVKAFMLSYDDSEYFGGIGITGGSYVEPDESIYDGIRKMSKALNMSEEELLGE